MRLQSILLFSFTSIVCAQTETSTLQPYSPPTAADRLKWTIDSTVGPASLTGGLISAGFGTLTNSPKEYGTHWDGFGKRYGMRLTGISIGNVMEASLGALWGEDPRYRREPNLPFGHRIGHVFKMTVLAYDREGHHMPAYSRYIGNVGNNFLSNTWRADSEATTQKATIRIGLGFLSNLAGNAWDEFAPDVRRRVLHRGAR